MNPTDTDTDLTTNTATVKVWDWPVRVFHWTLAASVIGAFVTGESEDFERLHQTLGWVAAGLIGFRVVWGLVGTRYARFTEFVRPPKAVWAYVKSLRSDQPQHFVGHNPVGAVAVIVLMGLTALSVCTGWLALADDAAEWVEEAHEIAANTLITLVLVHVIGVLWSSRTHGENLLKAMLTGRKTAPSEAGIQLNWGLMGLVMLLAVAWFMFRELWG
jgi:cytochrome b